MKTKPLFSRIPAMFALLIFLAACDSPREGDGAEDPLPNVGTDSANVLRKGNGAEPQTLDPHKAEGVPASNILRDLYQGLVSEAPNGDLVPGAAKSWEISDDGRVYKFYLREEGRWSNGDPLTAEDFVFGLRRSVDPATGSKYSQILSSIANAGPIIAGTMPSTRLGVTALDTHTLEIRLKAPTPYFLGLLTHSTTYPVHPGTIAKHGDRFSRPGRLVSNGAYFLADWVVQSHIGVVRNPHYWDNANTSIEQVNYYVIEDQSAELKRYRAGEIDWTETVPLAQVRWIKENLAHELKLSPYLGTYYYGFNLTKRPFKDNLALRKALSLAIDRKIIAEKIAGLGQTPAYGWVPPGVADYSPQSLDYATMSREQRHAEAQHLYQEAGYSEANPLRIQFRYNTSENHKKVAIVVASMWKKLLGVQTELLNEEWKVFLENRKQKKVTQVFRAGWIGDYNDAFSFAELMHSKHGINDSGYNNPDYDELLEKASLEADTVKRRAYLEEAERLLLRDHPVIPIYFYVSSSLIKPHVDGFVGNIMDHHYSKHFRLRKQSALARKE